MRRRVLVVAVVGVLVALFLVGGSLYGLTAGSPLGGPELETERGPAPSSSVRAQRDAPSSAGTDDGGSSGAQVVDAESGQDGEELTDAQLAARARELEEDPNTQAICDLALPVRHSKGYLAIGGHSDFNGRMVEVVNGKAYLPLVFDLGELGDAVFEERSGKFSLEGYGPVDIAWEDPPADGGPARCKATVEPEVGTASLTGTITVSPSGEPASGAWIEGCGNMAFADQAGIVTMDIVPEPCTVIAMRQDGMLRTVSEPVPVVPQPGQDVVIDLVIPEGQRGGLGVKLAASEDGVTIESVFEGSPADAAGLQAGDRVVAVDGEAVDPGDMGDFVFRVGGEAGTEVELTVDRAGEELAFTIVREALPG